MAGGLLQITTYGPQDLYLTNNPQITFFKVVYRRHTDFAIQPFELTFTDKPSFESKGRVKIQRIGDLITKMYLRVVINKVKSNNENFAWVRKLGHAIIKKIEVEIGGSIIDRHYGVWLDIWYELTGKTHGYNKMIGDIKAMTEYNNKDKPERVLYIPLQFWFNRHYGLALPLIALQYHDVYVQVEFEKKKHLIVRGDGFNNWDDIKINDVGLVIDYVYLDMEERQKFAKIGHEYLFEQVQYYYDETCGENPKRIILDFNRQIKELIWAMRNFKYCSGKKFLCYCGGDNWTNTLISCSAKILYDSMLLDDDIDKPGLWEHFEKGTCEISSNGNYKVVNNSKDKRLWINLESLIWKDISLTGKIYGEIHISPQNDISIDISCPLSEFDVSIPVDDMIDTRICRDDVCVYQFGNYGMLINGKGNPLEYAMLEYNDDNRIDKRNGRFFGDLQPYLHHSCTPTDGINLYSFALEPEKLQPTGTANFSKIDNVILSLWMDGDEIDNKLYIFGFSYNVLRIMGGFSGIVYG